MVSITIPFSHSFIHLLTQPSSFVRLLFRCFYLFRSGIPYVHNTTQYNTTTGSSLCTRMFFLLFCCFAERRRLLCVVRLMCLICAIPVAYIILIMCGTTTKSLYEEKVKKNMKGKDFMVKSVLCTRKSVAIVVITSL